MATTLSADFTADVDYTPCGFMYRKFFTEDWTTVQVTPENDHLELVVTDFVQSTEYEFMVFYTVDGETYLTDPRYFKTPEVPMPAITSMTVEVPLVEGHMKYVWDSLTPGERYGFRTFRTNAYEKRETAPVFFTSPLE